MKALYDVNFEKKSEAFESYFKKNGFSEFEKLIGVSVEEFKETYERYKEFVQNFYEEHIPESDTLYPLVAEICPYVELDFITAMESLRSVVRYPAVSVFEGEYYATAERGKIDFLDCEEVMKRLLELYKVNEEVFEEERRLAAEYKESPIVTKPMGFDEETEEFPF